MLTVGLICFVVGFLAGLLGPPGPGVRPNSYHCRICALNASMERARDGRCLVSALDFPLLCPLRKEDRE